MKIIKKSIINHFKFINLNKNKNNKKLISIQINILSYW